MFYVNSWQLRSILGMTFLGQATKQSALLAVPNGLSNWAISQGDTAIQDHLGGGSSRNTCVLSLKWSLAL